MAVNCDPNLRVCNNEIDEVNYGGQDKCQHGVLKVAFSDPRGGGRGVMRGREEDPEPDLSVVFQVQQQYFIVVFVSVPYLRGRYRRSLDKETSSLISST